MQHCYKTIQQCHFKDTELQSAVSDLILEWRNQRHIFGGLISITTVRQTRVLHHFRTILLGYLITCVQHYQCKEQVLLKVILSSFFQLKLVSFFLQKAIWLHSWHIFHNNTVLQMCKIKTMQNSSTQKVKLLYLALIIPEKYPIPSI